MRYVKSKSIDVSNLYYIYFLIIIKFLWIIRLWNQTELIEKRIHYKEPSHRNIQIYLRVLNLETELQTNYLEQCCSKMQMVTEVPLWDKRLWCAKRMIRVILWPPSTNLNLFSKIKSSSSSISRRDTWIRMNRCSTKISSRTDWNLWPGHKMSILMYCHAVTKRW